MMKMVRKYIINPEEDRVAGNHEISGFSIGALP
jgi:hypothetical protein